jgi:pyridoxine 4-dehydrogenase
MIMRLGLGTMSLCGANGWGEPPHIEQVQQCVQHAYDAGIRCFDSAGFYGPDVALRLLKPFFAQDRGLTISTKVGLQRDAVNTWRVDASVSAIRQQVEHDLRTLGTDCLPLVFLRLGDGKFLPRDPTPLQESLNALVELQSEGKLRAIGLSECTLPDLEQALQITPITAIQNRYNLRQCEDPILAWATAEHCPYWAYSPLASGLLLKRAPPQLVKMAQKYQATPAQIASAWLLARSPMLMPIVGTQNPQHLLEHTKALSIQMSAVDRAILEQLLDLSS